MQLSLNTLSSWNHFLSASHCVFLLSHLCYLLYCDPFSYLMASRVSVVWKRGGAWGSGKKTLLSPGWPLFWGLRRQQGTKQPFLKARHCAWHFTYTVSFSAHSNPFRKFYFSFWQMRKLKPRGVKSFVKVNTGSGWLNQDTRPRAAFCRAGLSSDHVSWSRNKLLEWNLALS